MTLQEELAEWLSTYQKSATERRNRILQTIATHQHIPDAFEEGRCISVCDPYASYFDDFELIRKLEALDMPMSIETRDGKVYIDIVYA